MHTNESNPQINRFSLVFFRHCYHSSPQRTMITSVFTRPSRSENSTEIIDRSRNWWSLCFVCDVHWTETCEVRCLNFCKIIVNTPVIEMSRVFDDQRASTALGCCTSFCNRTDNAHKCVPVSVCMYVCLSVTSRCSVNTAKFRITPTTPNDSPGTMKPKIMKTSNGVSHHQVKR